MLDLEKRTPEQTKRATEATKDSKVLSALLDGLSSKKEAARYNDFKTVMVISQDYPDLLYPKWDFFTDMLRSKDPKLEFQAIHILANLAGIDRENKFEETFTDFYDKLNGQDFILASHVAYVSHKIIKAKPRETDKIANLLLNTKNVSCKHGEIVQANALISLSECFLQISDKSAVVSFAKQLRKTKSPKAKKAALEFLKKWSKTD